MVILCELLVFNSFQLRLIIIRINNLSTNVQEEKNNPRSFDNQSQEDPKKSCAQE
jgi:hypothetical protein